MLGDTKCSESPQLTSFDGLKNLVEFVGHRIAFLAVSVLMKVPDYHFFLVLLNGFVHIVV